MTRKPYGKAYKITEAQARAYERTSRPRRYTPNPLGVTSMAAVNGRGSYESARSVSAGKTKAERIERARRVIRNGENMAKRAGFLKNRRRTMRRNEVAHEGWQEVADAREAGGDFHGPYAKKTRARNTKKATAKKTTKKAVKKAVAKPLSKTAKVAKAKRGGKRLAAFMAAKRAGKTIEQAKRSALRAVPLKVGETFKGSTKKKKSSKRAKAARLVVGAPKKVKKTKAKKSTKTYKRLYLLDPKTGKKRLSFMAKGKKGKKTRIPAKTLVKTGYMTQAKIDAARKRAAERILKSGDAFVPNKKGKKKVAKKSTAKQKRAGKRLAAYRAAIKKVRSKAKARAAALRAVPLKDGDTFLGASSSSPAKKTRKKRKTTKKRSAKKATRKKAVRRTKKTTKRKTGAKKAVRRTKVKKTVRKSAKRVAAAKKAARTRKRNLAAKRKGAKSPRKSAKRSRKMKRNGRGKVVRHTSTGQISVVRRKRRRGMRRNGFMAQLKSVAITGLFVAGGFLAHKVLTGLLVTNVFDKLLAPKLPASFGNWKKPICGAVTLLAGVPAAKALFKKNATEISAGMAASLFQSIIVAALTPSKPSWAAQLQGYENSRAYGLRGPVERHALSIGPRYTATGNYAQAAAGYEQAAAGYLQAAAGTGEYFQANGTGEYFAPNNLQGVGSYEAAGSLAMQAAAGVDEIDDGIRPDSDIDGLLDLAEAAAGLRGTGEFYTAVKASGGRVVSKRVGESSQWIPAGPLWAGADFVEDTQDTSELSAGILQRQGGNGVLSAG